MLLSCGILSCHTPSICKGPGGQGFGGKNMAHSARSAQQKCLWHLLGGLILFSLSVMAQDTVGRIIGVVTDPSGSVIPRAKVTVTNVDTGTNEETTTGTDGSYQV